MKSTYRRLIQILSCSLAIVAVLLCSVCIPANAASWTTVNPSDHIKDTHLEGNVRVVTYDFGIAPLCFYTSENDSGSFIASTSIQLDHVVTLPFNFGLYPLGKYAEGGGSLSSPGSGQIAIDVSDFKSEAILKIGSRFHISFGLMYDSIENSNTSESYMLSVNWSFMQYSSTGEFLGFKDGSSSFENFILQDTDETFLFDLDFDQYCPISIPDDNVRYIVPLISADLIRSDYTGNIDLRDLRFSFDDFTISTSTDMLLKESLTLQAIEGELGELNDKADTIINGSDEMNQTADDLFNDQQDLDEQLSNAMAELEDLEDISDELLADQYTDFYGSIDNISGFLVKAPWFDMTNLIGPIMEFAPMVTILTLLVAFINISILFFGR